jgi:hypothetical protein
MYCLRCYADLRQVPDHWCPTCGLGFDRNDPKTFLARPFPRKRRIVLQLVLTTLLGILVAGVVATFQMVQSSGH